MIFDITNGAFQESDWGATTIREFVHQYPEIVDLEFSIRPPTLRLLESAEPTAAPESANLIRLGPQRRIRSDLWDAVLDFGSSNVYVWDKGSAIPVPSDAHRADDPRPVFPTVTKDEFAVWRAEFVATHDDSSPPILAALETWRDQSLGTRSLPPQFRGVWTAEIKRRVVERLVPWFTAHQLEPPPDLVETVEPDRVVDSDVEALRQVIVHCVEVMTRAELEGLLLPAAAVARARR